MPAAAPDTPRLGANCQCSTSITRCGSARSSASCRTATAPSPAQLAYWEDALAGLPERMQLPTDRPYPLVADQRGAAIAMAWPAELQRQIARVARDHNATSFMVVQAALAALLSTISATSDVAVGVPIAGRRDPALDELVGFFVNTLVLRVDVAGDPTFSDLLDQVKQRSLAAYENQDVSFEVLVERLNPARSLTHHPLVQVMLAWQNFPGQGNDLVAGLTLGDLARHADAGGYQDRPHGPDLLPGGALDRGRGARGDRRDRRISAPTFSMPPPSTRSSDGCSGCWRP